MEVPETNVSPEMRLTLWEYYRQEDQKQKEKESSIPQVNQESEVVLNQAQG